MSEGNNLGPRFYRSQRHDPHFLYESQIWNAYKIISNSDIDTLVKFLSDNDYEIRDLRPFMVFRAAYQNTKANILKDLVENGFDPDNLIIIREIEKLLDEHDTINIFTGEEESKFYDSKVKEYIGIFLYSLQFGKLPDEYSSIPNFLKDEKFDIMYILRELNKRVNLLSDDAKNIIKYLTSLYGENIITMIHSVIQAVAFNKRKAALSHYTTLRGRGRVRRRKTKRRISKRKN